MLFIKSVVCFLNPQAPLPYIAFTLFVPHEFFLEKTKTTKQQQQLHVVSTEKAHITPSKTNPRLRGREGMPSSDMVASVDIKLMFGVEDSLARHDLFVSVIWNVHLCKPYQS